MLKHPKQGGDGVDLPSFVDDSGNYNSQMELSFLKENLIITNKRLDNMERLLISKVSIPDNADGLICPPVAVNTAATDKFEVICTGGSHSFKTDYVPSETARASDVAESERQRSRSRERESSGNPFIPRYFMHNGYYTRTEREEKVYETIHWRLDNPRPSQCWETTPLAKERRKSFWQNVYFHLSDHVLWIGNTCNTVRCWACAIFQGVVGCALISYLVANCAMKDQLLKDYSGQSLYHLIALREEEEDLEEAVEAIDCLLHGCTCAWTSRSAECSSRIVHLVRASRTECAPSAFVPISAQEHGFTDCMRCLAARRQFAGCLLLQSAKRALQLRIALRKTNALKRWSGSTEADSPLWVREVVHAVGPCPNCLISSPCSRCHDAFGKRHCVALKRIMAFLVTNKVSHRSVFDWPQCNLQNCNLCRWSRALGICEVERVIRHKVPLYSTSNKVLTYDWVDLSVLLQSEHSAMNWVVEDPQFIALVHSMVGTQSDEERAYLEIVNDTRSEEPEVEVISDSPVVVSEFGNESLWNDLLTN